MPTYEYRCTACDHAFERFQQITAAPIKRCPECGKAKVKRLIGTGAGLLFKGSGFYITDYRPDSYNKAAKADGPPAADSKPAETKPATDGAAASTNGTTPAAAKSEPKPEPKPEAKRSSKKASKPPSKKS